MHNIWHMSRIYRTTNHSDKCNRSYLLYNIFLNSMYISMIYREAKTTCRSWTNFFQILGGSSFWSCGERKCPGSFYSVRQPLARVRILAQSSGRISWKRSKAIGVWREKVSPMENSGFSVSPNSLIDLPRSPLIVSVLHERSNGSS